MRPLAAAILTLPLAFAIAAAPPPRTKAVAIREWLELGPVLHPLPALHEAASGGFGLAELLADSSFPEIQARPAAGLELAWFSGAPLRWHAVAADKKGIVPLLAPPDVAPGQPAVAWLASYLATDRWQALELELTGTQPRAVWLDGVQPLSAGTFKGEIKLVPGKHLVLVRSVLDPSSKEPWSAGVTLKPKGEATADWTSSLDPRRNLELRDVLDAPQVTSLALSPDGETVAAGVTRVVPGTDAAESWIELVRTDDGAAVASWRGAAGIRQLDWSPDGRWLSYIADVPPGDDKDAKKTASLVLVERESRRPRVLLERIERLGGYRWSPTSRALVTWTTVEAEKDKRGVKRLQGLMDRWAGYRDKQYLHLVTVPDGLHRRLTAGGLTTSASAFSPDGTRLLFTRTLDAPDARPYQKVELWQIELSGFTASKLRDFQWLDDVSFAPDGQRLLVRTQAGEFGDAGVELPAGTLPNSYDGELFVWDPASGSVDPITRGFDPAVMTASWSRQDGRIYLTAEDHDYVRLFRWEPAARTFTPLPAGADVVGDLELADHAPVAVALGSSPWEPASLLAIDLPEGRTRTLWRPGGDALAGVARGEVEPFRFTASSGKTIEGRVYLPPAFDAARRYPAIVYYYGGTSPVGREFGGRYPKEWWAGAGYVVYVLQPSGATGFGQAWSAAHVNDWGKTTSQEIIEGTRKFLETHPYVDPKRVGCIGASYGGFMTMLLATETDLFAAAVSHAGISSLASYWGEGYWGYSYSATATAGSFPWNRRDLYVDQSPLFRADQTRVPILLTHGTADTNVPVGESDQLYVALQLLGKPVEYVQVQGEDHWILDHAKRMVWSSTILAWFERWLKGRPEWWNDLYPTAAKAAK
ncbi:MAG TPA: S9 family peptidase [Candidatus Polarisedimenticolaceae bacterium]|nr:S9 family peptidase [Candidatus Polarisedimenticolaceae bacterium]